MKDTKSFYRLASLFPLVLLGYIDVLGVTTSFTDSGAGTFTLEVLYAPRDAESDENATVKGDDFCDLPLGDSLSWNTVSYAPPDSANNPEKCTYQYRFKDLEEASQLYQVLEIDLKELSLADNGIFKYEVSKDICTGEIGETIINWTVNMPGEVRTRSNNVESVVGNTLSWRLTQQDCEGIFADARIRDPSRDIITPEPTPTPPIPTPLNKDDDDKDISDWIGVVASIAGIIGTGLALLEYKKRK